MAYLFAAAILLHALWVLLDARRRGNNPLGWAIGAAFLWPFVVPFYLAKRNLKAGETREGGVAWNVLRILALVWTVAMLAVGVSYAASVGKVASTAGTDPQKIGVAIGGTLGIAFLLGAWFLPVLAAVVVGLLVRKSSLVETGPTGPLVGLAPGVAPPASTARDILAVVAMLALFVCLGVQAYSASISPEPRATTIPVALQSPLAGQAPDSPKPSVAHLPEAPAASSSVCVSLAVYRGEVLTECADMECTGTEPRLDAGVRSPELVYTGLFDAYVASSYNLAANRRKESRFRWTKLDRPCAEAFRGRSPLATCEFALPWSVMPIKEKHFFYLVQQAFDRNAATTWCMPRGASWPRVSQESEEYRRESLRQATPDSPAILPYGQGMVMFGKPSVKEIGFSTTKVMVQVQNVTEKSLSCMVKATFMDGDTILGTAQGTVNQIPANATKTAELLSADKIRGYSVLKLQTDTCF